MSTPRRPRHGSMAYYPRKRARSEIPHIRNWPEIDDGPRLQGFAGYKAGMTHIFMKDYRTHTTTAQREIWTPVTVVEVPPLKIVGIRLYEKNAYGLKIAYEILYKDKKTSKEIEKSLKKKDLDNIEQIKVIVETQPKLVKSIPKKSPETMEIKVGGGTIQEKIDYVKELIGKEIDFNEFKKAGRYVDIVAITKGKGFQGPVKRFGIKLLTHKNSKHRRMIGTLGPWHPNWVRNTVPQAGQMGYHQRTEYNKRVLYYGEMIDDNGNKKLKEEITPKGGFLHYGEVNNQYVLLDGSIPGPSKRLIRLRDPMRKKYEDVEEIEISYISRESKQGA